MGGGGAAGQGHPGNGRNSTDNVFPNNGDYGGGRRNRNHGYGSVITSRGDGDEPAMLPPGEIIGKRTGNPAAISGFYFSTPCQLEF